ncbi:DUF707 domain-containing protein [Cohnella thermotolerans]|uniref:DUF707 domain-containing protein n=1 Tax=Cohnella thermotolerans TaxID=329858 RepID=UPI00040EEC31|nr:DUF707 domain-containing protein [Cohnella thermotolerans]
MANLYLVVCRAGDSSLHREWIRDKEFKNFDLLIDYYGDEEGKYREDADFYFQHKSYKWPVMYRLIRDHPQLFEHYRAVWFPDDDLLADTRTIHDMFELFSSCRLMLAQPALTEDSYVSHHVTLQNRYATLRYVDFVEVMAPIFSREALMKCHATFNLGRTGWGLDFIWPKVLGYPSEGIAVLDATPVKHTRPVGGGEIYSQGMQTAHNESSRLLQLFQVTRGSIAAYKFVPKESSEPLTAESVASLVLKGNRHPRDRRSILEYYYPTLQNLLDYEQGDHSRIAVADCSLPDYEQLAETLAIFADLTPDNVQSLTGRILSLTDEEIMQAVEFYDGNQVELLNSIAAGFYYNEAFDRVLPYLMAAFRLDDKHEDTLYNLGYVLRQFGESRLSLQYLERIANKSEHVAALTEEVLRDIEAEGANV